MNKNSLKQMIIAEMIYADARELLAESHKKRSLFEMMDDDYLAELDDRKFVHSMKLKSTLFEADSDSEDAPEDLPDSGGTPDDSDSEDAPEDSPDDDSGGDPDDSDSEDAPEDAPDDDSEDAPEDSPDDDSGGGSGGPGGGSGGSGGSGSGGRGGGSGGPGGGSGRSGGSGSGGSGGGSDIGLAYLDTLYDDPSLAESRYSLTSLLYDL